MHEPLGRNQSIADSTDGITKIRKMVEGHTSRFIKNPPITAIVFSEDIFNNESSLSNTVKSMMQRNQDKMIQIIAEGQKDGSIRNDIDSKQLSLLIMGSFRFLVNKWHLNKYAFNLHVEVESLLNSIEKIIRA